MNFRHLFIVISVILVIVALFMFFPILFGLFYGEFDVVKIFLICQALIGLFALSLFLGASFGKRNGFIGVREGFLLVSLSWVLVSLFGALPFRLSGAIPSFTDAFFETMSGFTTTGASILTAIEPLPKALLFWRSLTHWLGGMGIVVLTVAVLPLLGTGGLQMLKAEAPGPTVDKITPKITATAKILWFIYLGLTLLETALLMFGGMDLFDSLTHAFGTMATGGFSPKNSSVGFYHSPWIHWIITIFMMLAGVNFILYFKLLTGRVEALIRNTELKAYLFIFFLATGGTTFVLFSSGTYVSFGESLRHAGFQVASILTTTGYATTDYELWPAFTQAILFSLMFIGGCSGSTGGGIKVVRIVTLLKQGFNEMRYLAHPRAVFSIRIDGKVVRKHFVYTVSGFFFLYIALLITTTLVTASSGSDLISSFTTALATVGNIGPGFGSIGPTDNYAAFPDYVKWFLSFAMMAGRLEVYTVLILFTPRFWKR
jgi:trk system potassium uptake protein